MSDGYWTQMENDICFVRITEGYENWCKGNGPGANLLALAAMAFSAITSIVMSVIYEDPSLYAAGAFCGMLGYAAFSQDTEWPLVLDEYLNDYQPVDTDAFTAFQASVKTDGELQKETLGKWIDVEHNARRQRPCSSSGMTCTCREMASHKKETR